MNICEWRHYEEIPNCFSYLVFYSPIAFLLSTYIAELQISSEGIQQALGDKNGQLEYSNFN